MNTNKIKTTGFSNPEAETMYQQSWNGDATLQHLYDNGGQCGACSFFAPFNADYGLCCNEASRHLTETVFEHFTCVSHVAEGWGPHSFSESEAYHCKCEGEPIYKAINAIIILLDRGDLDDELRSHLRLLRQYVERHKD